ncbi:MAG: signal peptidase I [Oscillospiraceae bacterium]|jgi:signal peptidase I|nr:signal peptidase I [Oscillospiraceae bacterium]
MDDEFNYGNPESRKNIEPDGARRDDGVGEYGSLESRYFIEKLLSAAMEEKTAEPESEALASRKKEAPVRMEVYDWIQCVVSTVLCTILIFMFVGRQIGVDGTSMLPTLHHTDRVIMSNLLYTPKNKDIIIIKTDTFGDTPIVKRVIAVGGQTVAINFDTGEVRVDGVLQDEPYINALTTNKVDFDYSGGLSVPEGSLFVMGDNRNNSTDSRSNQVGLIDTRNVLGKVLFILLPGADENGLRAWSRIGSVYK